MGESLDGKVQEELEGGDAVFLRLGNGCIIPGVGERFSRELTLDIQETV